MSGPKKDLKEDLFIRCDNETRVRFRRFWVDYGFDNYQDALNELLNVAEKNPKLVKVRWG